MPEGEAYLAEHDVPLMVNELMAELLRSTPLTPRRNVAAHLPRLVLAPPHTRRPERRLVYLLGGPGSGKGTLAGQLCHHFGPSIACVGAGELLRQEMTAGTAHGEAIRRAMVEARLVPGSILIPLLKAAVEALPPTVELILIDGFPRNFEQVWAFEEEQRAGLPDIVLNLLCPDDLLLSRVLKRAATSDRPDDTASTARKRIARHHHDIAPCVEYYRARGVLVDVDASGDLDILHASVVPLLLPPAALPDIILGLGGTRSALQAAAEGARLARCGYLAFADLAQKATSGSCDEAHRFSVNSALALLRQALYHLPDSPAVVLLTGFPTTLGDALAMEGRLKPCRFALALPPAGDTDLTQHLALCAFFEVQGKLRTIPEGPVPDPDTLAGLLAA